MGTFQVVVAKQVNAPRNKNDQGIPSEEELRKNLKDTKATVPTQLELKAIEKFLKSEMTDKDLSALSKEMKTENVSDKLVVIKKYNIRDEIPSGGVFSLKQAVLFNGVTGENFVLMFSEMSGSKNKIENTKDVSMSKNMPFSTIGEPEEKFSQKASSEQLGMLAEFVRCNHKFEVGKELPKDFAQNLSYQVKECKFAGTAKTKSVIEDGKEIVIEIPGTEEMYNQVNIYYKKNGNEIDLGYVNIEQNDSRVISLKNPSLKSIELKADNIKDICVGSKLILPPPH